MEFIQNLINEIAKPFRVEVITLNPKGEQEIGTTFAADLEEAIEQIARFKEIAGQSFQSARIFNDHGENIYELDYSPKAWASAMDF